MATEVTPGFAGLVATICWLLITTRGETVATVLVCAAGAFGLIFTSCTPGIIEFATIFWFAYEKLNRKQKLIEPVDNLVTHILLVNYSLYNLFLVYCFFQNGTFFRKLNIFGMKFSYTGHRIILFACLNHCNLALLIILTRFQSSI